MKVKLPFIGEQLILTLFVVPICIIVSVWWAVSQDSPNAFVGQDIMVVSLFLSLTFKKKKKTLQLLLSVYLSLSFILSHF